MRICLIDFETNGLKPNLNQITEIGAMLVDGVSFEKLAEYEALCWDEKYPPQPEVIVKLTGITDEKLKAEGKPFSTQLAGLCDLLRYSHEKQLDFMEVDFFMAHNARFDMGFFHAAIDNIVLEKELHAFLKKVPWLCSMRDLDHSDASSKKLSHLALHYGITVDPSKLHRALGDLELMLGILQKVRPKLGAVAELAATPEVLVRAVVPPPFGPGNDGGKGKDKAKECGFGWQKAHGTDGPVFEKQWIKKVRETDVKKEEEKLGYKVQIVQKA